jgi:hypothetical protein
MLKVLNVKYLIMKFLIQKINREIRHDFTFALLESIRFKNWLTRRDKKDCIKVKFINTPEILEPNNIYSPIKFKEYHRNYTPVGSVEFVNDFLMHFYNTTLKPINVPEELFSYTNRHIFNGTEKDLKGHGKSFVKSNDNIKQFAEIVEDSYELSIGNYQISEVITIDSEWRAFVYQNKLVGLQNYSGDFTMFPNVDIIKMIISAYKSAPIAYTLDVGVFNVCDTFVIEVHAMVSVGLYGFADHTILPQMFYKCFKEHVNQINTK